VREGQSGKGKDRKKGFIRLIDPSVFAPALVIRNFGWHTAPCLGLIGLRPPPHHSPLPGGHMLPPDPVAFQKTILGLIYVILRYIDPLSMQKCCTESFAFLACVCGQMFRLCVCVGGWVCVVPMYFF